MNNLRKNLEEKHESKVSTIFFYVFVAILIVLTLLSVGYALADIFFTTPDRFVI